ncbi:MAG TPA: glycosyltransferase family 1 protein [Bacteroidetes bacterium]|nr:glycosyltransferase family 1 protein [Bacteroidota bacterium]
MSLEGRPGPHRVLYLSLLPDLSRGGQNSLLNLLGALDRSRVQPALVTPAEGALAQACRRRNIPVFIVPWPRSIVRAPGSLPRTLLRLSRVIRAFRPDIIHADAPRNAHLAALVRGRAKLVAHLRVADPDGFSDRLLSWEADALVAVSRGTALRFEGYPEARKRKLHLIYNAVDIERFHPVEPAEKVKLREEFTLPIDRPVVGFIAGFIPMKRHAFLLELWGDVVESAGLALLALLGRGSEDAIDRLKEIIRRRGIENSVRFLPFVERPERFYPACDLVVLPSGVVDGETEGFPRVVIEAGACGVPAVVSDLPGTNEGVDHGRSGLALPPEDSGAWASELSELLLHPERREAMGRAARQYIVEHFSLNRHAEAVMNLYDELASGGK